MGAGKTTLGRELGKSLNAPVIDTDEYIEEREGKSISEIFADSGERHFRQMEANALEDILEAHVSEHSETLGDYTKCTLILSLGGGIVTVPACRELIRKFTYCIYIKTDINTIFSRLEKDDGQRAMLHSRQGETLRATIEKLYQERRQYYEELAQKTIEQ